VLRSVASSLGKGISAASTWLLVTVLRLFFRLLTLVFYRIHLVGREHLPRSGPALIVCNHVSWLDGLFLFLSSKRPIRFLIWAPMTQVPLVRWLLRLARVIPIDPQGGPRSILKAMSQASAALNNGELVGIFAEGSITRTGFLLPFNRGFEQILKKSPVPIIPACLDRLWGSIFSYQGRKFFWKMPQRIPHPVTIAFGPPMPADSKAWRVRQAVQELQAHCFDLRKNWHRPAHRQFVRMACRHPFRPCIIDGLTGRELNFAQALSGAILLTRLLRPRLGQGKMVGLLLPTTLGGALANIAVAFLGKVSVNLNYTASKEAVWSAVQQCEMTHLLTSRAFRQKIAFEAPPNLQLIDLEDLLPQVGKVRRALTYLAVVLLPGFFVERVMLGLGKHTCDDVATVIFSSGSTGEPKGVVLSQHNIVSNMESVCQAIDPFSTDRILAVLPFFHSFGYTVTLWLPLIIGASAVYYPDPRQAKEIGELCRRHACTIFLTTPTFLRLIVRRCDKDDFRTVRILVTGAEKLPTSLALQFKEKFGLLPLEGYGCTELSPVVSVNVPDWESDGRRQLGQKLGTIGQPLPGIAIKIVDPDTGETLPPGVPGLLMVRGPNVMVGYLNKPEMTREAIVDGWYNTGDIAQLDEDGFITITDRLSRFSKIGGEMVPHQRIEDEIQALFSSSDRICAVVGVPDEKKGEKLVVVHVPFKELTPQQVHQKLAQAGLPNLWLPDLKNFVEVPELPLLATGKLDLQKVKKAAKELLAM